MRKMIGYIMGKIMTKKIISVCCMLITIVLMALPSGVSMTFAPNPSDNVLKSLMNLYGL